MDLPRAVLKPLQLVLTGALVGAKAAPRGRRTYGVGQRAVEREGPSARSARFVVSRRFRNLWFSLGSRVTAASKHHAQDRQRDAHGPTDRLPACDVFGTPVGQSLV